jgi:hypothetical protein
LLSNIFTVEKVFILSNLKYISTEPVLTALLSTVELNEVVPSVDPQYYFAPIAPYQVVDLLDANM